MHNNNLGVSGSVLCGKLIFEEQNVGNTHADCYATYASFFFF